MQSPCPHDPLPTSLSLKLKRLALEKNWPFRVWSHDGYACPITILSMPMLQHPGVLGAMEDGHETRKRV